MNARHFLTSGFVMGLSLVIFANSFGGELERLSLDQLAAIQTFLRAEIDGSPGCSNGPKITPEALTGLPELLESRVAARRKASTSRERKSFFSAKRVGDCAAKCRCGIYADWIGESDLFLADVRKELLAAEARRPLSEKAVAKCSATNREWICGSAFFRALVTEGNRNAKGNGT
jgi:hypothetical protein